MIVSCSIAIAFDILMPVALVDLVGAGGARALTESLGRTAGILLVEGLVAILGLTAPAIICASACLRGYHLAWASRAKPSLFVTLSSSYFLYPVLSCSTSRTYFVRFLSNV